MLIVIWDINYIIAHKLLIIYCKMPSDSFYYQTINNFEKFLDQKSAKNTSKTLASILLIIRIYIRPIKLLENGALNTKFNADERLHLRSTSLDREDGAKIKKAITANKGVKDNKDKEKYPRKKNR